MTMRLGGWLLCSALIFANACGARSAARLDVDGDASARDTGARDVGVDVDVPDANMPDVNPLDANVPDTSVPDAGCSDCDRCGNSSFDEGEECDLGNANGRQNTCCDGACRIVTAGRVCRSGSGDACDPDEACDGVSAVCPEDAFLFDATACANGSNACSDVDTCVNRVCVLNDFPQGTPCGDGVAQPTCAADSCDGNGVCIDRAPLADGEACGEGGNTCCNAVCEPAAIPGVCDPCQLPPVQGRHVLIIDDTIAAAPTSTIWNEVALPLGLTTTTTALDVLDNLDNLAGMDAVIVTLYGESDARRLVLQRFIEGGGGVYMQGEWDPSYASNQVFAQLVSELGGAFMWNGPLTDNLVPTVSGCLARYPNPISALSYFWWGASGNGTVAPFLSSAGGDVGFSYCPDAPSSGLLVHTSDRDWIAQLNAQQEARLLMANILTRLVSATSCQPPRPDA